jgi:hypothetical protein
MGWQLSSTLKQTKLELRNHTLCFADVREKTRPDIILQLMKCEPKINGKPKETNQMKFCLRN